MKKITIEMACSINGLIATDDGNEDFLSYRGWEIMLEFLNVTYCDSIDNCLKVCEKMKYEKIFISGGAIINNAFMEKGIVDNIILNYNPFVLNKGIPLFKGNYFENKLKLEKIVKEKEDIVQVHYSIIK